MLGSQDDQRVNALSFVIFKEEEVFVAACLERYIGAQGDTLEEAKKRLRAAYRAELDTSLKRGDEPFGGIPRAPERFHELWKQGPPAVMRGTIFDENSQPLELAA